MKSLHRRNLAFPFLFTWLFVFADGDITDNNLVNEPTTIYSEEQRVISLILERYKNHGTIARPVKDYRTGVNVLFGLRLVHLDLDEKEQVMRTSVWVRMSWVDEHINWNPEDYNHVTSIVIPADKIWVPDIALVNTADTAVTEKPADVVVKFDGHVYWNPHRKYSSACLINVTEYPYDRHTCDMWFQSISYNSKHLNISEYFASPLDLDTYLSSYKHAQEWTIVSNMTEWYERPRDVGMILVWSRRSSLKFTLSVQRRPGFTTILLVIPCALLSFLIPLVFCLPPERPDRHSLAMSVFSSLTILLFMVNEVAPPTASFVPRLTLYYCFNLLILILATCCSVSVVNISKRAETRERIPKPIKIVLIKGIGKVLCFGERLNHLSEVKRVSKRIRLMEEHKATEQSVPNDTTEESVPVNMLIPQSFPSENTQPANEASSILLNKVSRQLLSIESQLRQNNTKNTELPDISIPMDIRVEWYTLSMVLDRLFFIIFLVANFISFGCFYPRM